MSHSVLKRLNRYQPLLCLTFGTILFSLLGASCEPVSDATGGQGAVYPSQDETAPAYSVVSAEMITTLPRPCERQCKGPCGLWKHYSRFRSYRNNPGRNSTVSTSIVSFSPICRDCEQKGRNEKKNLDRPKAIIEQRAKSAASKAGVSFHFFWTQMNYRALVPVMRAMLSPESLCLCCGHKFESERDIQIEHHNPPRYPQDWALLHTRNLGFACGSCNRTKGAKPNIEWLDEQEGARLSNIKGTNIETQAVNKIAGQQFDLFKF